MATAHPQTVTNAARRAATAAAAAAVIPPGPSLVGRVVSAGRMERAIKVETVRPKLNTYLQKSFRERRTHLVSDPGESARPGDVVRMMPWRPATASSRIEHVLTEIITPFGPPLHQRPPVTPLDELLARRQANYDAKLERRAARAAEKEAAAAATAAQSDAGSGIQASGVKQHGDLTGRKIDEMADESLDMEAEAEEIERRAREEEGIEPNKTKEKVRL